MHVLTCVSRRLQRHQPQCVLPYSPPLYFSSLICASAANGKVICAVAEGTPADVETAVKAARRAFQTTWGINVAGAARGKLLSKLADLMEARADELAALEALDNGKTFAWAQAADVTFAINTIRYYAGWADKNHGKTIEVRCAQTRAVG